VAGLAVMFVRVWIIAFPLPAEAPVTLPTGAIATIQENDVEGVVLESAMLVVPPEQRVCEEGVAVTIGDG
jgi:hypothetical protein